MQELFNAKNGMDIKKDIAAPVLVAFIICVILCVIMIPLLHKMKFGQYIREEGPEAHKKKAGTPTMGGIMILLSFVAVAGFFATKYKEIIPILIAAGGFGLVGFLDDFIR